MRLMQMADLAYSEPCLAGYLSRRALNAGACVEAIACQNRPVNFVGISVRKLPSFSVLGSWYSRSVLATEYGEPGLVEQDSLMKSSSEGNQLLGQRMKRSDRCPDVGLPVCVASYEKRCLTEGSIY